MMNKFNGKNETSNTTDELKIEEVIKQKWNLAEDFYQERDNRTGLEVKNLSSYAVRSIEIWLDPHSLDASSLQETALLACNLTARWSRRIIVRLSAGAKLTRNLQRDGFRLLAERISFEMSTADPFGDFRVLDYAENIDEIHEKVLRVFIGSWSDTSIVKSKITLDDYFIDASQWSVFGRRGSGFSRGLQQETAVPAAAMAAALVAADLFKRAVGHARDEWMPDDFVWNIWEHKFNGTKLAVSAARAQKNNKYPVSPDLDLGRTLLAGVGAIGSALVYLMDFMNLSGELILLDRDQVETSNLNRSPLFNALHAVENWQKTRIASGYLSRHQIQMSERRGTWQEHAAHISHEPFDQWISLTNEDGAWATVPYLLPPIVLHGTTTSGWGFGAGRHIPRIEDCTLCRMPRPETKFRGVCAQGKISNKEGNEQESSPTASLPFLSAASAALVLTEMIKLNAALSSPSLAKDIQESKNEAAIDLRYGFHTVTSLKRLLNSSCRGCRASFIEAWINMGGRGHYRCLSEINEDLRLKAA